MYLITRSALLTSLNFPFIGVLSFLSFRAIFCVTSLDHHLLRMICATNLDEQGFTVQALATLKEVLHGCQNVYVL
jgi:hypothetical protein